jgi:hypothetical protein
MPATGAAISSEDGEVDDEDGTLPLALTPNASPRSNTGSFDTDFNFGTSESFTASVLSS